MRLTSSRITVGDEYNIHITDSIYRSSHIDSTLMALRPGLILVNSARVNSENLPPLLDKWEKIYFDDGTYKMSYQYKQIPVAGVIIEF